MSLKKSQRVQKCKFLYTTWTNRKNCKNLKLCPIVDVKQKVLKLNRRNGIILICFLVAITLISFRQKNWPLPSDVPMG